MRYPAVIALALAAAPILAQRVAEGDNNDSPSQATRLQPGEQAEGSIEPAGDEDWYSFHLSAAADLHVWTGPGLPNAIGDTRVALLDQGGAHQIIEVDDGNAITHGFYSVFTLGSVAAGDYYLVVKGYVGGSTSATGEYTLDLVTAPVGTLLPIVPLRPVFEGPESNDPRIPGGSASVSGLFTRNQGSLSVGGGSISWGQGPEDYDFYSFRVTSGGIITLATGPGSGTSSTDTIVYLLDDLGHVLAFDDDGGPSLYSRLSFDATPGAYFAVVRGRDAGSYLLDILGPQSIPSVGPATFTRSAWHSCLEGSVELSTRTVPNWPLARPELPVLGSTFCMDVTGLAPNADVFGLLDSTYSQAGFDLGLLGYPAPEYCYSQLAPEASSALLVNISGIAQWYIRIPRSTEFLGIPVEAQAVVFEPPSPGWPDGRVLMSRRGTLRPGLCH